MIRRLKFHSYVCDHESFVSPRHARHNSRWRTIRVFIPRDPKLGRLVRRLVTVGASIAAHILESLRRSMPRYVVLASCQTNPSSVDESFSDSRCLGFRTQRSCQRSALRLRSMTDLHGLTRCSWSSKTSTTAGDTWLPAITTGRFSTTEPGPEVEMIRLCDDRMIEPKWAHRTRRVFGNTGVLRAGAPVHAAPHTETST